MHDIILAEPPRYVALDEGGQAIDTARDRVDVHTRAVRPPKPSTASHRRRTARSHRSRRPCGSRVASSLPFATSHPGRRPSVPAVTTRDPSRLTATARTCRSGLRSRGRGSERARHRTARSGRSRRPPTAKYAPLASNATDRTGPRVCGGRAAHRARPHDERAAREPTDEDIARGPNATDRSLCLRSPRSARARPSSVHSRGRQRCHRSRSASRRAERDAVGHAVVAVRRECSGVLSPTFQTNATESSPAVTRCVPSGENPTANTLPECARNREASAPPRTIVTRLSSADRNRAVGRDRDRVGRRIELDRRTEQLAREVPDPSRPATRPGDELGAVGAEHDEPTASPCSRQRPADPPHPRRGRPVPRRDPSIVGRERRGDTASCVRQRPDQTRRLRIAPSTGGSGSSRPREARPGGEHARAVVAPGDGVDARVAIVDQGDDELLPQLLPHLLSLLGIPDPRGPVRARGHDPLTGVIPPARRGPAPDVPSQTGTC